MKKQMNYTIEFFRFMFAINYAMLHVLIIGVNKIGGTPFYITDYAVIIPFLAFTGYFLMQSFQRQKTKPETADKTPARKAWEYTKVRLYSLLPLTILVTVMCLVANCMLRGLSVGQFFLYLINAPTEIFGLQLFGMWGNEIWGIAAERNVAAVAAHGPMWFISGVFICGYAVYYLLCKDEDKFVGWIAPAFIGLFYGTLYLNNIVPMWNTPLVISGYAISTGLFHVFAGMSVGVLLWKACDNLKDVKWSKGGKLLLTLIQLLCTVIVFYKAWINHISPFYLAHPIGWGATFFYTTVFSFLCLLNVDYVTRFPLFASKIWKIPGRLSLYIYMLHYPIMTYVLLALGCRPGTFEQNVDKIIPAYLITIAIAIVVSLVVMKFEKSVFQPWLNSHPWFEKEKEAE